jgi:hypothetical protein
MLSRKFFGGATRDGLPSLSGKSKGVMHEFAIHLITSPGTGHEGCSTTSQPGVCGNAPLIWVEPRSVMAALTLARRFAPPGSVLEVWRDHECVHRETLQ